MKSKETNREMCDYRDNYHSNCHTPIRLDNKLINLKKCKKHKSKFNFKLDRMDKLRKNNEIDHRSKLTYYHNHLPIMNRQSSFSFANLLLITVLSLSFALTHSQSIITFEKLTNRDYPGLSYHTIRNVSLYECLGEF